MIEQEAAELFRAALDLEPEARDEFLDRACGGNPTLRARVDQLLAADQKADGFLESPFQASELLHDALDPAAALVTRDPVRLDDQPPLPRPPSGCNIASLQRDLDRDRGRR